MADKSKNVNNVSVRSELERTMVGTSSASIPPAVNAANFDNPKQLTHRKTARHNVAREINIWLIIMLLTPSPKALKTEIYIGYSGVLICSGKNGASGELEIIPCESILEAIFR